MPKTSKIRLDQFLLRNGFVNSINVAQSIIMQGLVHNEFNQLFKSGMLISNNTKIRIKNFHKHAYVARSALKLIAALDYFKISPQGMICLDLGAGVGGFTQVLIERGAEHVFAVDVAYGEFHTKLRTNLKITLLERCNAKYLTKSHFYQKPELIVCDASFIGLKTILPPSLSIASRHCHIILLIKPQFEANKKQIPSGGVLLDKEIHKEICQDIENWLEFEHHFNVSGILPSPILGRKGNQEFLLYGYRR